MDLGHLYWPPFCLPDPVKLVNIMVFMRCEHKILLSCDLTTIGNQIHKATAFYPQLGNKFSGTWGGI